MINFALIKKIDSLKLTDNNRQVENEKTKKK